MPIVETLAMMIFPALSAIIIIAVIRAIILRGRGE